MELRLDRGACHTVDGVAVAVGHVELVGLTDDYFTQVPDEHLAQYMGVVDVIVTFPRGAAATMRLGRPPGYGNPITHAFGATTASVLEPVRTCTVTVRAIDRVGRSLVTTLEVEVGTEPPHAECDELSALAPSDRAFVEHWARLAATGEYAKYESGDLMTKEPPGLRRLFAGTCTLMPHSTGRLDVSFWVGPDGARWFVHAGGSIAYRVVLYGPFV